MREIVLSEYIPVYLDENAKVMLKDAQVAAKEARLATSSFIMDGEDTYWFTWDRGCKSTGPFCFLGKAYGEVKVEDYGIALKFKKMTPLQNPGNLQKNF